MTPTDRATVTMINALALVAVLAVPLRGQVGKGLIDPNVAADGELRALPHMTPTVVKGLLERRPFLSVLELNMFLLGQKLTPEQAVDFYRQAFIHINLNTGTREEFVIIPGTGTRMAKEFAEYRPWKSWSQFDKEIGKYVGQQETDRFKQYMFIPLNINTASDADLLTIPEAGSMVRLFKESRPWKTKAQFEQEVGKAVGPKETARLWRYVVIQ
jgi:hypothetical protein